MEDATSSSQHNTIPTITLSLGEKYKSFHLEDINILRETCENIGFFYLKIKDDEDDAMGSHTSIHNLLPRVFEESKAFFSLPMHIKKRISNPAMNRGYTGMEEETLDPIRQSISGRGDTKEGYYIAEDIDKADSRFNPAKLSGPNVWPTEEQMNIDESSAGGRENYDVNFDCKSWKRCMMAYHEKLKKISFQLVQLIAQALDLEKKYFDACFQEPMAVLRLLHYSKEKSDIERGIFACGAHSDYGMLTLLATDDTPGLQIFHQGMSGDDCLDCKGDKNGRWIDIPPPPLGSTTFVVNLGDMMERWTNGRFKSTIHRVVTRGNCERYSIPFFYEPNFDTLVVPLENCIKDGDCPKYPPTTSGQHLLEKYNETHADFNK